LALLGLAVIGQSEYFGFSFTTLNFQSLYCIIRNLLKAHETEIISVQGYGSEKKTEIQYLKLGKKFIVFHRFLVSNAITFQPQGVFDELTNLEIL